MSYLSKPTHVFSASDYKNADELFASIKDAFEESNATIEVSFSTLDAVEDFASSVLLSVGIKAQPESDYVGYPYACKPQNVSMFYLNRLCSEIKALPDSFLPLSISFQNIEEINRFATDYIKSTPLSQLKNFINLAETRKPREPEKDYSKLIRWCLISVGIIVLAALCVLIYYSKKKQAKEEEAKEQAIERVKEERYRNYVKKAGFALNGGYTTLEYQQIMAAINRGDDGTITVSEFDDLPKDLQGKMITSEDVSIFEPLRKEFGKTHNTTNQTKQSSINEDAVYGLWRRSSKSGNSELINSSLICSQA